ncbi:MAG TPA: M23 family metallopeptidase [Candidatus Limnocylindria bacterium]|nr:M23 family metallopeptidase [Candidatus Limnocylindria bacterium]
MFSRSRRFALSALVVLGLLAAVAPLSVTARSAPYMDWPTVGRETQGYGCTGFRMEPRRGDCAHFHAGIDIANSSGTPIRAAAAGAVSYVGLEPWYHGKDRAWVVILSHGNGIKTIYVHLQKRDISGISKGRHVDQGQLIGLMGMTGRATGPHLHFGVWLDGRAIDPVKFLPSTTAPAHW